jgi:hypothetical protein
MAVYNKGITFGQLGRSEEEVGVYDEVVARFGNAPEPALREAVAMALEMKAEAATSTGAGEEAGDITSPTT